MFRKERYPDNWQEIRAAILQRAKNRCEGTPQFPDCRAPNRRAHPDTGSTVTLTIAHMWDMNPMACEASNLRALCNRCHLCWDRPHHLARQRENRERKKRERQPALDLEER